MKQRVDVVVTLFQGVIDEVNVYGTDEKGNATDKALAFLNEWASEVDGDASTFKTPEEFHVWYESFCDDDNEAHWYSTEVE